MRTFQEFLEEGLKSKLRQAYIQGRKENEPEVKVSHLQPASGTHQPMSRDEVMKSLNAQGGIGGAAVKRELKNREKEINKAAKKSAKRIKKELQTEQHPTMEPNEFNKQIAKRQAGWKGLQRQQAHDEMKDEARSQVSAKRARMKAIMSR